MTSELKVAVPPSKPLLIYDGDCHFCRFWVARGRQFTGAAVDYQPSQAGDIPQRFPEIPPAHYDRAVQLVDPDGKVFSGAEAILRAMSANPAPLHGWPLLAVEKVPGIAPMAEGAYNLIASHRPFFSQITRVFWGRHVEKSEYVVTRWFFLRALGLVYLAAFLSLWPQLSGLIGHEGILPAGQFMSGVAQQCDARGIGTERFGLVPTLCWIDASDTSLKLQCAAGVTLSLLLVFDVAPALCLFLLWMVYLSLVTVGQDFLSFQWDNLLLETGFLAIFLAPLQWLPGFTGSGAPSRLALWLLRLLLFKLLFCSGCVKLTSMDSNWRNLTALTYHYQTQPLPTWLAWYAHLLPMWFQKFSCAVMFAIELGAPFLIFGPRRVRLLGAAAMAALQLLILLSGNYGFFNYLTLALCLLLLDDFAFQNWVCENIFGAFNAIPPVSAARFSWPRAITLPVAILVMFISVGQVASVLGVTSPLLLPAAYLEGRLASLSTVNNYGLFAVMTTTRNEIIMQGSKDGTNWLTYEFKFKPGELDRRPAFVAPAQPRLDWQMWFAALGPRQQSPWFDNFCARLLEGSPSVKALLQKDPFPDQPPKLIRAGLYEYRFTTPALRRTRGAWWQCQLVGDYLPPVGLSPEPARP